MGRELIKKEKDAQVNKMKRDTSMTSCSGDGIMKIKGEFKWRAV